MSNYRLETQGADFSFKSTSKQLNAGIDEHKQQAWVRAMEQEQMQNWFGQGLIARQSISIAEPTTKLETSNVRSLVEREEHDKFYRESKLLGFDSFNSVEFAMRTPFPQQIAYDVSSISIEAEALTTSSCVQRSAFLETTTAPFPSLEKGTRALTSAVLPKAIEVQQKLENQDEASSAHVAMREGALIKSVDVVTSVEDDVAINPKQVNGNLGIFLGNLLNRSLSPQLSVTDQEELVRHRVSFGYLSTLEKLTDAGDMDSVVHETSPSNQRYVLPQQSQQEALRLHSEWSEHGVRIWLGIDQNVQMDMHQIALHIAQWLGSQKISLLGLVCNGKVISSQKEDSTYSSAEFNVESQVRQELLSALGTRSTTQVQSLKPIIPSTLGF